MSFGTTPLSTTTLGANQFPVSAVYIEGTAGGNLTALQGGPATTADASGNVSAPVAVYTYDGNNVTLGATTDASSANTLVGLAKAIKANTASVTIGSLPANASVNLAQVAGTATDVNTGNASAGTQRVVLASNQPAIPVTQSGAWTVTANAGANLNTSALALDTSVNGILRAQGSTTSGQSGPLMQAAVTTAAPAYTTAQTSPLSLTTAGALRVDNSAVTQPISGTITANAGSGTFTIQSNASVNLNQVAGAAVSTSGSGVQKVGIVGNAGAALDAAGQNAASPANELLVAGQFNTAPTTITSGNVSPLQLDSAGNLLVNVKAGGGSGGTSSSFSAAFPATGTAAGASDGTNMKPLLVDASGFLKVNVAAGGGSGGTSSSFGSAFPATGTASGYTDGTNMQGARVFDADTGAGTQYVAGANLRISASGGSIEAKGSQTSANSIPVVIASDQGAVPVSGTVSITANSAVNVAQVGGTNVVTGGASGLLAVGGPVASGAANADNPIKIGAVFNTTQPTVTNGQVVDAQATARGAQIVATGVDTFNVTVNAALPTGSNTIGAVTQASGPWTSNVTQFGGSNVVTGTGASGAGIPRVTISNDSSLAANQSVNVNQMAGSAVSTAAAGVQKVGIVGNAGATLDSTVGAGTAPANALVTGAVYNSSAPAPTAGQAMALQADQAGNLRAFPGIALSALSAWNSGTALNTTQTIFTNSGCSAVLVQVDQTSTITAGAITFENTYDGSNWVTIPAHIVLDPTSTSFAQISLPYTLQANTNKPFIISNNGWQGLRIKLSTAITGTGAVTPNYALLPYDPVDSVLAYSPTAANFLVTASQGGAPWSENITQFGGSAVATGTGASGAGIPRVTVSNDSTVGANSATGAAVPANAFYQGYDASTALPAAATAGNLVGALGDKFGRQVTLPNAMRDLVSSATLTLSSSTTETTLVAATAAVFHDLVAVVAVNTSATAARLDFRDTTAGAVIFALYLPAGDTRGFTLTTPLPQTSVNTNWSVQSSASVVDLRIMVQYISNK